MIHQDEEDITKRSPKSRRLISNPEPTLMGNSSESFKKEKKRRIPSSYHIAPEQWWRKMHGFETPRKVDANSPKQETRDDVENVKIKIVREA